MHPKHARPPHHHSAGQETSTHGDIYRSSRARKTHAGRSFSTLADEAEVDALFDQLRAVNHSDSANGAFRSSEERSLNWPKSSDEPSVSRWQQRRSSHEEGQRKQMRALKREREKEIRQKESEKHMPFKVIAGVKDSPLGIATCSPPRRIFVVNVELDSWAADSGISIGCEILEVNGYIASSMQITSFVRAMTIRPLNLAVLPPSATSSVIENFVKRDANGYEGFIVDESSLKLTKVDDRRGYEMQAGDIILAINRKPVATYEEYKRIASSLIDFRLTLQRKPTFSVRVRRDYRWDAGFRISHPPLIVSKIHPGSKDSLHPMKEGCQICAVNGVDVDTLQEYSAATDNLQVFILTLLDPVLANDDKETSAHRISMRVTLIAASGLRNRDAYCICEIPALAHAHFRTPPIRSRRPIWNVSHTFREVDIGDSLHVSVWDQDVGDDDLLGRAILAVSKVHPDGFEGDLILKREEDLDGNEATVSINVDILDDALAAEEEDSCAVIINILSASNLRYHASDAYCSCEVIGRKTHQFKTSVCGNTASPQWNHSHELDSFSPGEVLKFKVFDSNLGRDTNIGCASLPYERIIPSGFSGRLQLQESGLDSNLKSPYLNISVKVIQAVPIQVTVLELESLRMHGSWATTKLFCICEVSGRNGLNFKTDAIQGSARPAWNTRHTFKSFQDGDALDFTIWGQGARRSEVLGRGTLESDQITPNGFAGKVHMSNQSSSSFEALLSIRVNVLMCAGRTKAVDAATSSSPAVGIPRGGRWKHREELLRDVEDSDHSSAASSLFEAFVPEADKEDDWILAKEKDLKMERDVRNANQFHEKASWAAKKIQKMFRRRRWIQLQKQKQRLLEEEFKNLGQVIVEEGIVDTTQARSRAAMMRSHRQLQNAGKVRKGGVSVAQIHFLTFTTPRSDDEESISITRDAIETCLKAAGGLGCVDWFWAVNLVPSSSFGFLVVESMAFGNELLQALDATTKKAFMCNVRRTDVLFELEPNRHFREWQVGRHGDIGVAIKTNVEREVAAAGARWRMTILQDVKGRMNSEPPALESGYRPRQWDVEVVVPSRGAAQHVIYHCRHNGGLGNCLLMFLGLAQRAESSGYDFVHLDGAQLPMYGDITKFFPPLPQMYLGVPKPAQGLSSRWGCLGNNRGSQEKRGPLLDDDVDQGRVIAARHLHLHKNVEAHLLDFAAQAHLPDALGVHIRRTDKKVEAPSNMAMTPEEAARQIMLRASDLMTRRVFLASDDAAFLLGVHECLSVHGVTCLSWGSRLSGRSGKACHTDRKIPAVEKALDALADCFLLAQCRGLICTYSSLSVVSIYWSRDNFSWTHFQGTVV